MKFKNKIAVYTISIIAAASGLTGCQKMDRPALAADYPKDANPPGGPLKFYAAMDGMAVDSIRANFGLDNGATYVAGGVSGDSDSAGDRGPVLQGHCHGGVDPDFLRLTPREKMKVRPGDDDRRGEHRVGHAQQGLLIGRPLANQREKLLGQRVA